jgi:hypothetical protein
MVGEIGGSDLHRRTGKPVEPPRMNSEIGGTDLLRKAREAGGAAHHGW